MMPTLHTVEAWKRNRACPGMLPLFAACPDESAPYNVDAVVRA